MAEFWEENFREKEAMWGLEPAGATVHALELFRENGLKKILIPGFGYGRNAKIFTDHGFEVTGIEISKTAIALAREQYSRDIRVFHGSVSQMPYDEVTYEGIFCYALIHLLNTRDRAKLIEDCYRQIGKGGYMVFVAISVNDASYGNGERVGKDRFLTPHGIEIFFYDSDSVTKEFGKFGLIKSSEISEPAKNSKYSPSQTFWEIVCRRMN